jgi:hypothetical protein
VHLAAPADVRRRGEEAENGMWGRAGAGVLLRCHRALDLGADDDLADGGLTERLLLGGIRLPPGYLDRRVALVEGDEVGACSVEADLERVGDP